MKLLNKMFNKIVFTLAFIAVMSLPLMYSLNTQADHHASQTSEATPKETLAAIRAKLAAMLPNAGELGIETTPVEGVFRIEQQGNYAFVFAQGDYLLLGDLYNTRERVNLGEQAQFKKMAKLISEVPSSKMIVFGPKKPKRHITVFTDIDCGYCQKLHREVPELTDAGVQVRYLAFPRAGIGSDSYKKYVSVWCADDQQSALTAAKNGQSVEPASCENPIAESYQLGQQVGVRGTPTIIFDDGAVAPGYLSAEKLLDRLGISDS